MIIITLKHVYIHQLMNLQRYTCIRPRSLFRLDLRCLYIYVHLVSSVLKQISTKTTCTLLNCLYYKRRRITMDPHFKYIHVLDNVEHDALFDCACT